MEARRPPRRSADGAPARWAARVLLPTASMLGHVGSLGAQTAEVQEGAGPEHLAAVLEQVSFDQRLRLETGVPALRLEGRYGGTDDGKLALRTDEGVVHTRLGEIDRLWTRGRSTAKGALIGGAAGLVIGATYGALISGVACAETSCTALGLAAAGGGIGVAGGAAIGALVGLALPAWKLRFP